MPNPSGIVETVQDFKTRQSVSTDHVQAIIEDLRLDDKPSKFDVAMDGMVKPSTGEMMMCSDAEEHERSLTLDALIGENQYSSDLAIYVPSEDDRQQFARLPSEEDYKVDRESTASLWLHDATEVSRADKTLLLSPSIISVDDSDTDTHQQHFQTRDFDEEDAQELIDRVNQS